MNKQAYEEFQEGLYNINLEYQEAMRSARNTRLDQITLLWKEIRNKYPDWDTSLIRAFQYYEIGA